MKFIKLLLVIMASAMITLALGDNALAFHEGGVAYCAGCHTMHNSQDGLPLAKSSAGGYLLLQSDGASACLRCHADYGQLTGMGGPDSPPGGAGWGSGGDFYWLKRTWTWTSHGHESSSTGDSHGHNIVARDFGLMTGDAKLSSAPGGTFDEELSCASCHDPHGNANFRLLRDAPHDGANFKAAPIAIGGSRRTAEGESGAVSDDKHPAFLTGMSEWCAGCHTSFIEGLGKRMHPADQAMSSGVVEQYNKYVSTANPTGGSQATAYSELVPFQLGVGKTEADLSLTSTEGPDGSGEVMCLSCHRAHASAFPDAGRWDFTTEFLYDSHPAGSGDGSTPEEKRHSYYGRSFTDLGEEDSQRSLCNKCHGQDGPHGSSG